MGTGRARGDVPRHDDRTDGADEAAGPADEPGNASTAADGPFPTTTPEDFGGRALSPADAARPAWERPNAGLKAAASEPATLRRRTIRRLVAVTLTGVVVTAVAYALTVGTELGQLMGELILGGRTGTPDAVRTAEEVLATTSRAAIAAGGVAVVALALLQRREGLALVAGATIVLANATTQVLKGAILDRSDLLDNLFYVLPNSFPSGHVTAASSVAVALLLVLPPAFRNPTVILASVAVALVGASTMLAGWHRMADAIGGVYVAVGWAAGLTAVLVWRRGVEPVGPRTAALGRVSARASVAFGVVVLLIGSAAYLLALADPLGVLLFLAERGGSPALLVVGLLITTGASFLALGGFGLAIRDVRLDPDGPSARSGDIRKRSAHQQVSIEPPPSPPES